MDGCSYVHEHEHDMYMCMRCHRKQDTGYKIQDVRCKIPDLLSYDRMMYLVDKIIDLGDKIMDPWMRDHGMCTPLWSS